MNEPRPRYALYYAPRPEEALAVVANQWLQGTPGPGRTHLLPLSSGLDPRRVAAITAEPRRYGFHGTLKAPMALIDDVSETDFLAAVGRFAAGQPTLSTPPLALAELWGFMALVPTAHSPALQHLADQCVIEFDEFRRPASEDELARRRAVGLTPRQDELLLRWGYPHVLEEWRFHLTLTGRLSDAAERTVITNVLRQRFSNLADRPLPVRDLCVFRQVAPGQPFAVLERFKLGAARPTKVEVWQSS
jgi:putative phosphonate metabolism protein